MDEEMEMEMAVAVEGEADTAVAEAALERLSAAAATQKQLPEQQLRQEEEAPEQPQEQHQQDQPRPPPQQHQPTAAAAPAIDSDSLHPFLEATNAEELAAFMQVPRRALNCVELMENQKCTAKECPYPAAYRTASGNKMGAFPKCVLHNKQWWPRPPRKAHFLLGHVFLRPQKKPSETTTNNNSKLPPCCWHCCCGDDYCTGIGYTPYARSIPVRHIEGVLEALDSSSLLDQATQEKMRQAPKNFSIAPWHFHPNARELDKNGRWKLKPLESTLMYLHSTGELVTDDDDDWDEGGETCRGERVWGGFPPPTYSLRSFVELEVLPQLENNNNNNTNNSFLESNGSSKRNDLPLWAVEMAKADIQHIRSKLPQELFLKPPKKRRGPKKRKAAPPEVSRDELEAEVKRQAKRIQQLEKGWNRNDRIIQELRNENANLKTVNGTLKLETQTLRKELKTKTAGNQLKYRAGLKLHTHHYNQQPSQQQQGADNADAQPQGTDNAGDEPREQETNAVGIGVNEQATTETTGAAPEQDQGQVEMIC